MSRPLSRLLAFALTFFASTAITTACAQNSSAPTENQFVPTFRANTQLVVVDVTVTDKDQNPVHHLKASDFTLLENDAPQQIKSFKEHVPVATVEAVKPAPALPPGTFTNFSNEPSNSAINVILLDTLNTPITDQMYVHNQLREYLKNSKPGARIAIFGLNATHLVLLQSFSSDPELLKAAITQKDYKTSPLLDDPVAGSSTSKISDQMGQFGTSGKVDATMFAQTLSRVQQFEAEQKSFQLQLRAKNTLDAMNQLAKYLSGIPGRKNLIWFSGSFPLTILPQNGLIDPFSVVANAGDEFRETTNLLARGQIAVYPIDARGLMVSPSYGGTVSSINTANNPTAFAKEQTDFFLETASEHSTMQQMAEQTGGRAFINTNGLTEAVAKSIDAGSNYYTLTYSPTNTKWNGSFRKIQLKLQQQGFVLAYRRGYFTDDLAAAKHANSSSAVSAVANVPSNPMRIAMIYGSPEPSQVIFKAHVLPTTAPTGDTLAADNVLNPDLKIKGPYRRYSIDVTVDAHTFLAVRTPDGSYRSVLQLMTYLYDQDGSLISFIDNTFRVAPPANAYTDLLRAGLPLHQEISVPDKGEFYLRIGMHDLATNRVGAVEVPIDSVKSLSARPASSSPVGPPK